MLLNQNINLGTQNRIADEIRRQNHDIIKPFYDAAGDREWF